MKITEYAAVTSFTEDSILLTDGNQGTKKILVTDAILAALHLVSPENHRRVFRGKNLGNALTSMQKAAIQNGSFEDLWVGDYWQINGINWRIADFDYWYNRGDTPFANHHLAIVPETTLGTAKMNDASTTVGGYTGSKMYTANLATPKATITAAFGSNVLTHREYLINAVTSGYPSAGGWVDSTVELMNEPMVYGAYVYTPASDGTAIVKRYTNSQRQLALFAVAPKFINQTEQGQRIGYWLRDVASDQRFARVEDYGPVTDTAASLEYPIRPVFAIG